MRNIYQSFLVVSVIVLLLFTGCAHQQTPTGGPDDKTGPSPVSISPVSESVSVKTDAAITIIFSEWILPASVKGISIFPPAKLKTKVKGNRLLITPLNRLSDSTTYHLVVTSALKDLHNNPVASPLSITFSTGPVLDSGSIDGCVTDPAHRLLQPNVALFRTPEQAGDSGVCATPAYLAQTDSNGVFSFRHIHTGTYRLLAYIDKNSDYRLQEGTEDVYCAAESVITVTSSPQSFMLFPAFFDTSRQEIASVVNIDNRTIIGNWKKPYDTLINSYKPLFYLEPLDRKPLRKINTAFLPTHGALRFILTSDTILDTIAYRLIYSMKSIYDTAAISDTLRINCAAQADTTRPSLIRSIPDKNSSLHPSITFIWSEQVRLTGTLTLADTLGDTMQVTGDTTFSDTSRFTVPRALIPGNSYRIILLTSDGRDLNGNKLKSRDTTDTAAIVKFDVIAVDSLSMSLSGSSPCLDKSSLRKWTFKRFSDQKPVIVNDIENSFRFDSIPSGKGFIGTFIDNNSNNIPDPGRLFPFVPPEPVLMFPDTIEARARWDVEGVTLIPCDPCEQKRLEALKDAAKDSASAAPSRKK